MASGGGTCDFCGENAFMPYRCRYCGGRFCPDHRLPENHNCEGLRKMKENPRWRDYAAQIRRRESAVGQRRHERWDSEEDSRRPGFPRRIPFGSRSLFERSGDTAILRRNFIMILITALAAAIAVKLFL